MSEARAASMPLAQASASRAPDAWLRSRAGDFWFACAGGGALLLLLALALHWYGDRELGTADIILGELHLGATYDAVIRNRLWRRMPWDVIAIPLCIVAATYAMLYGGYEVWVTTAALYFAAWHRARQNFGIARYYQVRSGGALSPWHERLFQAAIYLPMLAGIAYFTSYAPDYEGDEYAGLWLDDEILWTLGGLAVASVAAYLAFTLRRRDRVHPGERWLVIANAIAFASAYVLGAWTVGFILVLALHHEIQYLYFTYAVARKPDQKGGSELRFLASFAVWPLIGLASWAVCKFSDLEFLVPFLVGGLLCHYWLDGRIWTARARRFASR